MFGWQQLDAVAKGRLRQQAAANCSGLQRIREAAALWRDSAIETPIASENT
jgi:hypothetical protein